MSDSEENGHFPQPKKSRLSLLKSEDSFQTEGSGDEIVNDMNIGNSLCYPLVYYCRRNIYKI